MLCWFLVPDAVAVVRWELMVEVVVALSKGQQSSDETVACRLGGAVALFSKVVWEQVHSGVV